MIQLKAFIIFINSALLTISTRPPAVLSLISNFQKTNNTSNETIVKEELIKNYLQQLLPNSKDFNTALSSLLNHDIKKIYVISLMKRNANLQDPLRVL